MDDCTRDDRPAGWRGEITVAVPMTAWDFIDLEERLSPLGQRIRRTTFLLLVEASGLNTTEKRHTAADQALIAGLEADGWHVTMVRQTR